MNDLVYTQMYANEIRNRLMIDQVNEANEENRKRKQFVNNNRKLHK